eukprot:419285-Amorphochlora_amoeboformis.AAC.2
MHPSPKRYIDVPFLRLCATLLKSNKKRLQSYTNTTQLDTKHYLFLHQPHSHRPLTGKGYGLGLGWDPRPMRITVRISVGVQLRANGFEFGVHRRSPLEGRPDFTRELGYLQLRLTRRPED